MTCNEFRDLVDELLDDLLPPEEAGRVDAHMAVCGACRTEREHALAFRTLLVTQGHESLEAWTAHQLTERLNARAASTELVAPQPLAAVPAKPVAIAYPLYRSNSFGRRWGRLALPPIIAAAAACVILALVLDVTDKPRVLVAGETVRLNPGELVESSPGRRIMSERDLKLAVERNSEGRIVSVFDGSGTFEVDRGHATCIRTPKGDVSLDRGKLQVRVRPDGAVEIVVFDGSVTFTELADKSGKTRREFEIAAPGVLGTDSEGRVHVTDVDRARDLETKLRVQSHNNGWATMAIDDWRDEVVRLRNQLAEARSNEPVAGPSRPAPGGVERVPVGELLSDTGLPWDTLGRGARFLLGRTRAPGATRPTPDVDAVAAVSLHADLLLALSGEENPADALLHPSVLDRIAPAFLRALAPEASDQQVAAAVADLRGAVRRQDASGPATSVPADAAYRRLEVYRALLTAARDHLGVEAAAEIASGVVGASSRMPVRNPTPLSDATGTDIVQVLTAQFRLNDDQYLAAFDFVDAYIEAAVAEQQRVVERNGQARFDAVRSNIDLLTPDAVRLGAADRVAAALEQLHAKLDLARHQLTLERRVEEILDASQNQRWDRSHWALRVFIDAD